MNPVAGERVTGGRRLRAFVLVMREDEIVATAVEIEAFAEQVERHRRALDVPTRPPGTPRRLPCGLTRLGGLPEREVHRRALGLIDLDARARRFPQLLEVSVRQCPVVGQQASTAKYTP